MNANVRNRLTNMILESAVTQFITRFEAAGGTLRDDNAPPLFTRSYWPARTGRGEWHWTTQPDGAGKWWSFRLTRSTLGPTTDRFTMHDQRQAAKAWARAEARGD